MPDVTYSIESNDYPEFLTNFLLAHPVPIDQDTDMPEYTDGEWIQEWGRQQFQNAFAKGVVISAMDAAIIKINIVKSPQ